MSSLADAEVIWLALTAVYLVIPPAWDRLAPWYERRVGREPLRTWLGILGQIVYALGIPYMALLLGVADVRRLGLAGLPGWPAAVAGGLVGLLGVLYLAWSWGRIASAAFRRGKRQYLLSGEWQALQTPQGWARLVLDALCRQGSWAFVRGAVIAIVGLYPGVFVGPVLVGAAWLLRPGRPESFLAAEPRARTLLTIGLAVVTAPVFLYAESLWLCALVHALGFAAAVLSAGRAYAHRLA